MARNRHEKASCMRTFPPSSQIESSLMFFAFIHSKSGDMSSARVGAFAQHEVAVAHEGVDFQNMKVGSSSPSSLHRV